MTTDALSLSTILNSRFALRRLLGNTKHHITDKSIPKGDITEEREPTLRSKLALIAKQIADSPDSILIDEYTAEERAADWNTLVKKVVVVDGDIIAIDARTRPGHKILDHYMPHFYNVTNHRGISVRSQCKQELLEKALLTNLCMHSTPYKSEIRRMLTMTGGLGSVTKYRAVLSKAIIQFFKAGRVLDPCAGWGGRMLGCLASNAVYVGCEPDMNTVAGLNRILMNETIPSSRARILAMGAETALPTLKTMEKFDLVLTSPPYFNLELYTTGDQSVSHHTTWGNWVEHWLKPLILGCLECLTAEGTSCWSVKNFKSDRAYPLADITKHIHKEAGWALIKTVKMTGSGRLGAKRIEGGKEQRGSEEETFCFKRVNS